MLVKDLGLSVGRGWMLVNDLGLFGGGVWILIAGLGFLGRIRGCTGTKGVFWTGGCTST